MTFSWPRLGAWVIALLVGAVYGLAGTVSHAYELGSFPLGLMLSLIGIAALLAAVRLLTGDRWATLATGVGAVLVTLVFSGAGPGGSVIVPAGAAGTVWAIGVPVLAVLAVAWPDPRRDTPAGSGAEPN